MNYMKSNKNGVKLLAAIMAFAMVFVAGFAIITNDNVDANTSTEANTSGNVVSSTTTTISTAGNYKVTSDVTVTVPDKASVTTSIAIYLQKGSTITITGSAVTADNNVTVTVYAANDDCSKYIGSDSTVTILAMSVGSISIKNVSYGQASSDKYSKLQVSGEVTTGTITGANDVSVATESTLVNRTVSSPGNIASIKYGVEFKDADSAITYHPVGASVNDITIVDTDTVKVLNGTVKVKYSSTKEIQFTNAVSTDLVLTGATSPTIAGTLTTGTITVTLGSFTCTNGSNAGLTLGTNATLNAYATDTVETKDVVIGATANDAGLITSSKANATIYAYGNIGSNSTIDMDDEKLTFVKANITSMTVKNKTTGTGIVSVTGGVDLDDGVIGNLSGTITLVDGSFKTSGTIIQTSTVNISSKATLTITDAVTLNGKMYVYGTITAGSDLSVNVQKNENGSAAEFRAFSGCVIGQKVTVAVGGSGDVDAIIDIPSESKTVSGTVMSDEKYTQSQDVVVSGYYDVKNSSTVEIAGSFEVPEGTTVTIYNGAMITVTGSTSVVKIAGNLIVEQGATFSVTGGKSVSITGTVQSEGTLTLSSKAVNVKDGGLVKSLGSFASAAATPMNVGAGSELRLGGTTSNVVAIKNSGLVVFDEVEFGAQVTVSNVAAGATVKIISFSVGKFATTVTNLVTIDDDDLIYNNVDVSTSNNAIQFKNNISDSTKKAGYSGITITSSVVLEGTNNTAVKKLDISGTIEIYNPNSVASENLALSIETSGSDVIISDKVALSDKVVLTVVSGVLLVSGELSALTDSTAQVVATGSITVTGQMVLKTDVAAPANVNAAYYKTKNSADATIHNYSTLSKAIEAGATEIKTYGTLNVLDNVDVPAGTTVNANGAVNIGSTTARNVKVSFANGATLKVTSPGAVSVYGTLEFENKKDNKVAAITSDVSVIGDVASKYTNIYTALGAADKGDVITITKQDAVTIDADITVKAGVTLSVPVGKSVTVNDNVTVTINGTVIAYSGFGAQHAFSLTEAADKSTLVINGKFMTAESGLDNVFNKYKTYGAYYVATTDLGTYTYIAPLTVSVEDAQTAGTLTLYGENKFSSVKVEATETKPVTIVFAASSVIEGDIEISNYVTIDANSNNDVRYDGTIKSAVGEIDIVNMEGFKVQSSLDADKNEILGVYKAPVKAVDTEGAPTQKFVIAGGVVTAHGTDANKFDADGAGLSIDTGATLRVTGAMEIVNSIVKGTLEVANGATLNVDEYLQINGTLTVAEAVTDKSLAAGSATIPALYIGVSKSSVGAAASVSAPSITNLTKVFLGAGSTISEDLLTGLVKNTKFVVDGADYMTVFTSVNINISTIKKPTVDGAEVTAWQYVNSSGKLVDITSEADKKVGEVTETTAKMKYDVYNVSFLVDSGVSDVYIDGVLVGSAGISGSATDIYLTAGTHQVTYKLKAGYGGDITITFDGKKAADGKFTISTDMPFKDGGSEIEYKIVISGAVVQDEPTPAPAEKDDGMGITDYLLIVLVILAAILVVVVAIRMMRS